MKVFDADRLKDLKLVYKLTIAYLILGIMTVSIVAYVSYHSIEKAVSERTFDQLSSINILKKNQLEAYFERKKHMLERLAASHETLENFRRRDISSGYQLYLEFLQENAHFESILLLDTAGQPISDRVSLLSDILVNNLPNTYLQDFLILCKSTGAISDFTGKLNKQPDKILIMTGVPVYDDTGQAMGILLALSNHNDITSLIYERTGLGETGESYIIGSDLHMRSKSRFFPDIDPARIEVRTIAAKQALKGISGIQIIDDYRGAQVLSVFRPLEIAGLQWAIISEIDKDEVLKPIHLLRKQMIIAGLLVTLVFFTITTYLARKIANPIVQLKNLLNKAARGIIPDQVPEPESMDEIGEMNLATTRLIRALEQTSDFAYEIGNGNFNKDYQPLSPDDVLGHSLIQMRDKLKILTENEIKLIKENSLKLIEGQEVERKRISRELHDGLGQLLTATRFRLGEIKDNGEVKGEIKKLLDETLFEVRRISNNLMPSVLIDFGLKAGLQRLAGQIEETSGVKVSLLYEDENNGNSQLPFDVTTNVYRIIQEALNNMVKYAEATEAEVAIFESNENIIVEIADNGKGFEVNWNSETRGLKNMKERVNILKGTFDIKSQSGKGTVIFCEIPILNKKNG